MLDLLLDASAVGKVNRKAKSEGAENTTKFSYFCTPKLRHFRVFFPKTRGYFPKVCVGINSINFSPTKLFW